ncbi:ComEC/Rec2 family competence protein [Nocardioides litoris]|uniref:ComEC/Rec2 family competence protein n=1 Tax=Nocardioides litoris TaxID=1926648 RepID=UPI001FE930E6|nr:ComEC/Rec2 family competence protein [Nocardioides litoris]
MPSITDEPRLPGAAAEAGRGADLRMPVLAAAAWAGALLGLLLPPVTATLTLVGACSLGLLLWVRGRPRRADRLLALVGCALVAGGVLAGASLRTESVAGGPVGELARDRAVVEVVGILTSDPRPVRGRYGDDLVVVRVGVREVVGRGWRHTTRATLVVLGDPAWADHPLGATVRTRGRLAPPDDRADGVAGLLTRASEPVRVAEPDVWWRGAAAVRASIRDAVAHRPADQRALVPALVDGDDADLDEGLEADFRTTGLTHLTAVSGTNLTLVVGFLLVVARWCGVRGRWLALVAALGIVGFVLLARTEPSVLRAAAMGTVGLVAMGANGRRRAVRGLSVAVVGLLLLQPGLAVAPGFVLSVLATAGIVLLAPGWRDALARWLPRWAAEAVAVPFAAQVACTPVVAAISGQVSLVAVPANLLVAPVVGPATVLGLVGGLLALVSDPVGRIAGTGAGWCVAWIIHVARTGADLPQAVLGWGTGPWALLGLVVVCVVLAALVPVLLARPRRALPLAAVLLLVVLVPAPTPGWPPSGWAVAVCDVGQGDAVVLNAGGGAAVVVDAGPDAALVDECLRRLEVDRVPLLVLTHFHADHVDGISGVFDGRDVGQVWTTSTLDPPGGVREVLAAAAEHALAPTLPATDPRHYGDVELQTVWPPAAQPRAGPGDGSTANDASVVLLARVGGLSVLLTGDVEPHGQALLAAALPGLDVDVLKVPHHGSRYQDLPWLLSLRAESALVSVGADNDYGHPAPDLVRALQDAGSEVHRTDEEGDLVVTADGRVHTRDP